MGLKMKKFKILGVYWKIGLLGGGSSRKTNIEGHCLKLGHWTVCRFKGELGKKEGGGVFRGGNTPMHTIVVQSYFIERHLDCDINSIFFNTKCYENIIQGSSVLITVHWQRQATKYQIGRMLKNKQDLTKLFHQ